MRNLHYLNIFHYNTSAPLSCKEEKAKCLCCYWNTINDSINIPNGDISPVLFLNFENEILAYILNPCRSSVTIAKLIEQSILFTQTDYTFQQNCKTTNGNSMENVVTVEKASNRIERLINGNICFSLNDVLL